MTIIVYEVYSSIILTFNVFKVYLYYTVHKDILSNIVGIKYYVIHTVYITYKVYNITIYY